MKRLSFVISFALLSLSAFSQSSHVNYSIGVKVGLESFDGVYVEGLDLNLIKNKFIYSVGYIYHREIPILNPSPRESYQQAHFLLGSFISKKHFHFEYQGGLGAVWGVKRTDLKSSGFLEGSYNSRQFITVGIPLKASVKYVPFKFMSIGLDFLVNINPIKSYSRPMLTLNFGNLSYLKKCVYSKSLQGAELLKKSNIGVLTFLRSVKK